LEDSPDGSQRIKTCEDGQDKMLEGQLNRSIMCDDETPQDMFNRLKKMVNNEKVLGSKKWIDRMLTERLMRAYTPMNYNVVALISQDPTYKRMIFDDVLGRIINHEIYIEEANHINNLYKGITTTEKHEIALKAINKSKNKQVEKKKKMRMRKKKTRKRKKRKKMKRKKRKKKKKKKIAKRWLSS
jgi:hypothetical protein